MRFSLILAGWGAIAPVVSPALAQIQPDTTLGVEQSIVTPHVEIKGLPAELIEGGAIRDSNLFHSFLDFNVGEGGRVYFANPAGIETILSRVTGNDVSDILGTLGVNGQASLYLLNPNGIIFGEGARLDVPGSFVGTTADAVVFENGLKFSASNPDAPPLLTINVTPGLQYPYGNNPANASITNSGNLVVGQDLRLAAGNLKLQGQLSAGRDLNLHATDTVIMQDTVSHPFIAAAGNQLEVEGRNRIEISALNHPDSGLFSGADLVLRSPNPIQGNAHYTTGGSFRLEDGQGNLGRLESLEDPIIRARGDVILGGYQGASLHILAGGGVTIPGGVEILSADPIQGIVETITLSDGTTVLINGKTQPTFNDHLISSISITPEPGTSSGDIIINANSLSLNNSARLVTVTLGAANGGDLQVKTAESIEFQGLSSNPINQDLFRALLAGLNLLPEDIVSTPALAAALNSIENPALAQISGSGLYALTAVGSGTAGNIDIETGQLFSQDLGRVSTNTIGQGDSGNLTINAAFVEIIGSSSEDNPGGLFSQTNGLGEAGNLTLNTDNLILRNGGLVSASTVLASGDGGIVTVNAAEAIDIIGTTPEGNFPSAIGNIARGTGDAGKIFVNTQRLMIRDGGAIGTTTFSQGDGGDLTVNASESIDIIGKAAVGEIPSAISVDTFSLLPDAGDAGNLSVNTRQLRVQDGAFISASTFGSGQGGNLQVNASESINLRGRSIDGFPSGLYAQGFGTGNAGDLAVNTDQLRVEDGARVTVATGTITDDTQLAASSLSFGFGLEVEFSDQATGNAGTMMIEANSIQFNNQGSLIARTISGEGGNINLQVDDLIEMRRNSLISAEAFGGEGDGGNIDIDTEFVVALEEENSDIVADAFGGNGGNITITAQNIFGLEFRPQRTPKSDITASSRFGLEGNVVLNTPDVDPSRGLNQLPTQPVDVRGLVAQVCRADVIENRSQFVITGRGGLPPKPNELLRGEAVLADWIPLASEADESVEVNSITIPAQNASTAQIVEANGWVIDAEGNVTLIRSIPKATPNTSGFNPSFCD
ncbi:MAG: S-layer family protein [Coleofasciculus sp. C1-SOL-03]|uniref:two-partner secretion domain-containing protein n=1 Tax=Coleofasciculus sp. C1-SOL-03 TaxID=3069522 RepID=UPI0033029DC5